MEAIEGDAPKNPPARLPENRVVVEKRKLLAIFKCGICQDTICDTKTVMECAHRFCSECIEKALRTMKGKFCPQCRCHIPSRRSLRPDPSFDALIAALGLHQENSEDDDEEEDEDDIESVPHSLRTDYKSLRKELLRRRVQSLSPEERQRRSILKYSSHHEPGSFPKSSVDALLGCKIDDFERIYRRDDGLNIVLERFPGDKSLPVIKERFIRTAATISTSSLKNFISVKLYTMPSDFLLLVYKEDLNEYEDIETRDNLLSYIDKEKVLEGEHLLTMFYKRAA